MNYDVVIGISFLVLSVWLGKYLDIKRNWGDRIHYWGIGTVFGVIAGVLIAYGFMK